MEKIDDINNQEVNAHKIKMNSTLSEIKKLGMLLEIKEKIEAMDGFVYGYSEYNEDGYAPVHLAAMINNKVALDDFITNHAANLHVLSKNEGYLAIQLAAERGNLESVKFLTDTGSPFKVEISHQGSKPGYNYENDYKGAEYEKVKEQFVNNPSASELALINGHLEVAKFLIDHGDLSDDKYKRVLAETFYNYYKKPLNSSENNYLEVIEHLLIESSLTCNEIGEILTKAQDKAGLVSKNEYSNDIKNKIVNEGKDALKGLLIAEPKNKQLSNVEKYTTNVVQNGNIPNYKNIASKVIDKDNGNDLNTNKIPRLTR